MDLPHIIAFVHRFCKINPFFVFKREHDFSYRSVQYDSCDTIGKSKILLSPHFCFYCFPKASILLWVEREKKCLVPDVAIFTLLAIAYRCGSVCAQYYGLTHFYILFRSNINKIMDLPKLFHKTFHNFKKISKTIFIYRQVCFTNTFVGK